MHRSKPSKPPPGIAKLAIPGETPPNVFGQGSFRAKISSFEFEILYLVFTFWRMLTALVDGIAFSERQAMSRLSARFYMPVVFAFLLASSAMAQKSGSSGSGSSGSGSTGSGSSGSTSSGSSTTTQPGSSRSTGQPPVSSQPQFQSPLYVSGRILMENGQPVPEFLSVSLGCGGQQLQAIHTDSKGYFQFSLGGGPQGNVDFSASNNTPLSMPGTARRFRDLESAKRAIPNGR